MSVGIASVATGTATRTVCKWCISGRLKKTRKRYLARLQRRVNGAVIRNSVLDWLEDVSDGRVVAVEILDTGPPKSRSR